MHPEKPKLLIVDDETDICTVTQSYFGKRGFIVSTTGNGLEALTMIEVAKPDIVLLDLTLGNGMNGADVLKDLREYDKNTKVIVISGNTDETVIDKLYNLGITGFYGKPIILAEIAKKVYEELGFEYDKEVGGQTVAKTASIPDTQISGSVHQLSNKLNIISGDCEELLNDEEDGFLRNISVADKLSRTVNAIKASQDQIQSFLDNYEDSILKQKTTEELFKMNFNIIKNIVGTVQNTMNVVEQKKEET